MQNPKCQVYPNLPFENLIPGIDSIHYDGWTLRVKLIFRSENYELVYLDFKEIIGFRMLGEGDLLDFANDDCPTKWLLSVLENGWYEQEKLREGFTTQYGFNADNSRPNEYLVLGQSYCLSVLTGLVIPKITYYEQ